MKTTFLTIAPLNDKLRLLLLSAFVWTGLPALADNQLIGITRPSTSLNFSSHPSELEIFNARVFDQPLVPIGRGSPSELETKALADALAGYSNRTNLDDFSSLTTFLANYPDSKWSGSLSLHLGSEYYNVGYYSKALETWEQAWNRCKDSNDPKGKSQADRALGELARMYSKLGRMHELEALLNSTTNRPLSGPGTQLMHAAQQALWMMENRPDVSFRCGPLALSSILAQGDPAKAVNPFVFNSKSTTNGYSLSQVGELSRQMGLNYQAAFRPPGVPFIVPAVIHWKAGHYAALLQKEGDRFLVQDLTFRGSLWMTTTALNEEASGYFLVPPGPLPAGWRLVSEQEAERVWGKGNVSSQDSGGTGPNDGSAGGGGGGSCGSGGLGSGGGPFSFGSGIASHGMATYTMHIMLGSLTLNDIPVGYSTPVGPDSHFIATYNQLEANQPATFYYSNLGQKWDFNWMSYITDNPTSAGANVSLYQSGGGTVTFTGFNSTSQSYGLEMISQTTLIMKSSSSYEQQFQDGSKREFTLSDGSTGSSRRIFMTQLIDPAGNAVQLKYDSQLRLTNIVDAIGQATTLSYANAAYPYAITAVTDPFGRTAYFQYNSSGLLSQITDVLGLTSQFIYGANDFVSALTTPYGTTTFSNSTVNGTVTLQATDPLGESELLESAPHQSSVPDSDPPNLIPHGMACKNEYLSYRNSLFWDKKAFADGAGDYTKATIYHFLHESDLTIESRVLESVKQPLENRVVFNYPGQASVSPYPQVVGTSSQPSVKGRVLDDGTSQLYSYRYNGAGNVTNSIDPVGRTFSYIYASNNVDLLSTLMTHNGKSELLSRLTYSSQHRPLTITDASGQTMTNTYNTQGQILTTRNAKDEVTSFSYATNGYLLTVTGPLQNSNDVTSFTYDGFGRVRTVSDTEGYTLTFDYDVFDRKTRITYPDGTYEQFVYSNLDLLASCDRLGRWTTNTYNADRQLVQTTDPLGRTNIYDWCSCGSLTGITDPMGRTTTWRYDVQSRPIAKTYPDASTITYAYEKSASRLNSRWDEKGQETLYQYYADNTLKSVSYPNAIVTTPTVTYAYDPDYNRVISMQDGIGTTTYTYNRITQTPALGAGRLVSASGPLPNSTVNYQYDQLGRIIARSINGVSEATTFDVLGRPLVVTNALGTFQNSYVGATTRLASESYPNGQTNLYSYYNNIGDERLQQIRHFYPNGSLLSAIGYSYNAFGQITGWTNQWDTLPTRGWLPSYDAADQLTNVASIGGPSSVNNYAYAYDAAGNRLLAQIGTATNLFYYNSLNQIMSTSPGLANSTTYEWDAENRLTAINRGTNRSEFGYDGLGRRVQIQEMVNGVITTNDHFLWCGSAICEERDAGGGTTLKRYFKRGVQIDGGANAGSYVFTKDHLGSIRELLDSAGASRARYDYDPYGLRIKLSGDSDSDFGFTGFYYDTHTALCLALYRAYSPLFGRWLSRDPIAEKGGLNLYAYVANNPVRFTDSTGLYQVRTGGMDFGPPVVSGGGTTAKGCGTAAPPGPPPPKPPCTWREVPSFVGDVWECVPDYFHEPPYSPDAPENGEPKPGSPSGPITQGPWEPGPVELP